MQTFKIDCMDIHECGACPKLTDTQSEERRECAHERVRITEHVTEASKSSEDQRHVV